MKLINKKTEYLVENSNNNIKLSGGVIYDENDNLIILNGSFTNLEDQYIGSFNYNYRKGNLVDRTISQINRDYLHNAEALLDSTLDLLINEFNFKSYDAE